MANITRRRLLASVTAGPLVLAVAPRARAAIDPFERKRPGHLKLSLAAYSLRQYLDFKNPKMDMFGFVDFAADQGLDAVEPTSYWFPPDAGDSYFHRLQQHAFRAGLDISGTAIRNDFCVPAGPKREAELAAVRTWIDRASILGAPVMRVFGGTVPAGESEPAVADRVVSAIEELLPYAVEKGVTLALENHGGITETPEQLLRLVRAVHAPHGGFGVNLDTGNFRGADPYADIAQLAPYAVNVQVKTEVTPKGKPKQDADLARVIAILKEARYPGYVVLEYEAAEDPLTAVPRALKELQALIR
jgi:sugar phosphate isomerase/epimerase